MQINRMSIKGFGLFADFEISDMNAGLTVIYGENETGKSTILAFIRAMLFDFRRGEPNRFSPFNTKNHGGTVQLLMQNGQPASISRNFAARGKNATIFFNAKQISTEEFEHTLGGATRDLFRNIYAFSLSELSTIQSLEHEQVKTVLYGASVGSGIKKLPTVQTKLERAEEKLWLPKSDAPIIKKELIELAALRENIEQAKNSAAKYEFLQSRIEQLEREIKEFEIELAEKRTEQTYFDKLLRHFPEWQKLDQSKAQFITLSDLGNLSQQIYDEYREKKLALEGHSAELAEAEKTLLEVCQTQQASSLDSALLSQSEEVEKLFQLTPECERALQQKQVLDVEIDQLNKRIAETIGLLGYGWDLSRVKSVIDSSPEPTNILQFNERFASNQAKQKALETNRNNQTATLQSKSENVKLRNQECLAIEPRRIDCNKGVLLSCREGLEKFRGDYTIASQKRREKERIAGEISALIGNVSTLLLGAALPSALLESKELLQAAYIANPGLPDFSPYSRKKLQEYRERENKVHAEIVALKARVKTYLDEKEEHLDLKKVKGDMLLEQSPFDVFDPQLIEEVSNQKIALEQRYTAYVQAEARQKEKMNDFLRRASFVGKTISLEQLSQLQMDEFREKIHSLAASRRIVSQRISELVSQLELSRGAASKARIELENIENAARDASSAEQDDKQIENERSLLIELSELLPERENLEAELKVHNNHLIDLQNAKDRLGKSNEASSNRRVQLLSIIVGLFGTGTTAICYMQFGAGPSIIALFITAVLVCIAFLVTKNSSASHSTIAADLDEYGSKIRKLQELLNEKSRVAQEKDARIRQICDELQITEQPDKAATNERLKALAAKQKKLEELKSSAQRKNQLSTDLVNIEQSIEQMSTENELSCKELAEIDESWASSCKLYDQDSNIDETTLIDRLRTLQLQAAEIVNNNQTLSQEESVISTELQKLISLSKLPLSSTVPPETVFEELTQLIATAQKQAAQNRESDAIKAQLENVETKLSQLDKNIAGVRENLEKAENARAAFQLDWEGWLQQIQLPPTFTLHSAGELIEKILETQGKLPAFISVSSELDRLEQSMRQYRTTANELPGLVAYSSKTPEEYANAVSAFIEAFDANELLIQQKNELERNLDLALTDEKRASEALNAVNTDLRKCGDELSLLNEEWRAWLSQHHLDLSLNVQDANKFLNQISDLWSEHVRREQKIALQQQHSAIVSDYLSSAKKLLHALAIPWVEPPSVFSVCAEIHNKLRIEQQKESAYKQLDSSITTWQSTRDRLRRQHDDCKLEMSNILQNCACDSEDAFEDKYRRVMLRNRLEQEIKSGEQTLCKLLGLEDSAALSEAFSNFDVVEVNKARLTLELEIDRLEKSLEAIGGDDAGDVTGMKHQLSSLITERDLLSKSTELRELRAREEVLLTQIKQNVKEFVKLSLAQELLARAKKRFEAEGQPHVLEIASGIFEQITDGKYTAIRTSDSMQVIKRNGDAVPVANLSTGTKEQLYLALRFAFVEHRAASCERLPIVMDDILVNSDMSRARKAVEAIEHLSQSHQVIFFTCHPPTLALLKNKCSEAKIITLSKKPVENVISEFVSIISSNVFSQPSDLSSALSVKKSLVELGQNGAEDIIDLNELNSDDGDELLVEDEVEVGGNNGSISKNEETAANIYQLQKIVSTAVSENVSVSAEHHSSEVRDERLIIYPSLDGKEEPRKYISFDSLERGLNLFSVLAFVTAAERANLAKHVCNDAISLVRRAEKKFTSEESSFLKVRELINKGAVSEAQKHLRERMHEESNINDDVVSSIRSLVKLGQILQEECDLDSADIVWRALGHFAELPETASMEAVCWANKGIILSLKNKGWVSVQEAFKRALAKADSLEPCDRIGLHDCYAECAWESGNYGTALDQKQKVLLLKSQLYGTNSEELAKTESEISDIKKLLGKQ